MQIAVLFYTLLSCAHHLHVLYSLPHIWKVIWIHSLTDNCRYCTYMNRESSRNMETHKKLVAWKFFNIIFSVRHMSQLMPYIELAQIFTSCAHLYYVHNNYIKYQNLEINLYSHLKPNFTNNQKLLTSVFCF